MFENVWLSILFWCIIVFMMIFARTMTAIFSAGFVGLLVGATQCDSRILGTILYILSGLCLIAAIFMGYRLYKLAKKGEMKKDKDGWPSFE